MDLLIQVLHSHWVARFWPTFVTASAHFYTTVKQCE